MELSLNLIPDAATQVVDAMITTPSFRTVKVGLLPESRIFSPNLLPEVSAPSTCSLMEELAPTPMPTLALPSVEIAPPPTPEAEDGPVNAKALTEAASARTITM